MVFSFSIASDSESANTSVVAGLNATARPNRELAFRKPRRDLSSGCFTVWSLRVVAVFWDVAIVACSLETALPTAVVLWLVRLLPASSFDAGLGAGAAFASSQAWM